MTFDKEIVVDLWKTDAHGVEMGIKKDMQLRAKSRQFTKDTEIIGNVKKNDKEAGYVSFRTVPWEQELPNKRIIVKLFTKSVNWKASLEELVARGVSQSISAEKGLPSFIINVNSNSLLIPLEKVQRHGSFDRAIYSFIIVDEKTNYAYGYSIEADRLTIGSDFDVFDVQHNKIGKINGSKFNIGGLYKIEIDSKSPFYRKEIDEVLILFATLIKFLDDVEKKLFECIKVMKKGKEPIKISDEETRMYENPRRITV